MSAIDGQEAREDLLTLESRVCSYGDTVHYAAQPAVFARCEGSYLYDREDRPYLDLQMWYSAVNLGYANRRVNDALKAQVDRLPQLASQYLHVYYLKGSGELVVFCASLMGACIGFLWYNTHPAEVFMGDTGSLALGGALAAVSILLKSEFLLLLVGAVFVAEMFSVILQRFVFKYRKRRYGLEYAREHRVFKRAPLHHHYEVKGWDEAQVVVRFWILGVLSAFIALSTLKLR